AATLPPPISFSSWGMDRPAIRPTAAHRWPGPVFTYLADVFVNHILPNKKPDLTIFWSTEPDATNHAYQPGTCSSIDATRMNAVALKTKILTRAAPAESFTTGAQSPRGMRAFRSGALGTCINPPNG